MEDIWRLRNTDKKRYTWRQKLPRVQCRLDYFLISHQLLDIVIDTDIMPSMLSDHSQILLDLKYLPEPILGSGLWKMNASLLSDEDYKNKLKKLIHEWLLQYRGITDHNVKWELIKYEVRKFSIHFSKNKSKIEKEHKDKLEEKLKVLEELEYTNITTTYLIIRSELKEIELAQANGVTIRSRAEWVEK